MMVEGTVIMSASILETFIPFALHDFREKISCDTHPNELLLGQGENPYTEKKVSCLTICILLSKEILVKKSTFSLLEIVLKSQTYNLFST